MTFGDNRKVSVKQNLIVCQLILGVIGFLITFRQKKAQGLTWAFDVKSLAIPYFRMAKCHTIIGAKRFHFRVRDGIGWFTLAMVTKQTGVVVMNTYRVIDRLQ